jgi:uncharacterized protein YqgC (DUF456 family)
MSWWGELLVGLAICVGLVGVVVQVLPGSLIILGAVLVWAIFTGGALAWTVFVVGAVAVAVASVVKYVLAGRHMKRGGVPNSTLWWGGLAGIVGFFLIPVVGLFVGFIGGVYLAERVRLGDHRTAWPATVAALKATGVTILVELAGALVAVGAWLVGLALS